MGEFGGNALDAFPSSPVTPTLAASSRSVASDDDANAPGDAQTPKVIHNAVKDDLLNVAQNLIIVLAQIGRTSKYLASFSI